jgi:hypothetical protein
MEMATVPADRYPRMGCGLLLNLGLRSRCHIMDQTVGRPDRYRLGAKLVDGCGTALQGPQWPIRSHLFVCWSSQTAYTLLRVSLAISMSVLKVCG